MLLRHHKVKSLNFAYWCAVEKLVGTVSASSPQEGQTLVKRSTFDAVPFASFVAQFLPPIDPMDS